MYIQKPSKEVSVVTLFATATIFIVLLINLTSLYHIKTLHGITENLYYHSLKVSNATLNIEKNIFDIHRHMENIVFCSSSSNLEKLIQKIDKNEKEVYSSLEIVKANILGKKERKLYKSTYKLFKEYKDSRSKIIELIKQNNLEKAKKDIQKNIIPLINKLEKISIELNKHIKIKTVSFKNEVHSTFENFQTINIILTILTVFVLIIFTMYIKRRIKNYILSIAENEKKIKDLNERFKLAIDGTNDGLWDWNLEDGTIYLSPRVKEMLGYKDEELNNELLTLKNMIHPEDIDAVDKKIKLSQTNPSIKYNSIYRMRHKNGSWVWILDRGQTIFDENQKAIRMIGFHTDITRQKELEFELLEKEHLLQEAQRLSHMGSWKLDFETYTLTWSDEVYNIFGLDKKEFEPSYEKFLSIIHPDDREKVDNAYKNSLKTKKPYKILHRLSMKDGSIKYVDESCETTFDSFGNPLISIGTVQDVSSQKILEDKLINLKQQFEQFMEFMPANIIIKENDVIVYANSSATNFFQKDNIEGETFSNLFTKEISDKLKNFEQETYKHGFNEEIFEMVNNKNEKKVYRNMSFVIDGKEHKKLGIVNIDITKEYHANKEIAKVLSAFERSNMSVVITDLDGDIQYVNPSWCKITGYTRDELIGQNPRIVKSGFISPKTYKKMWQELTNGKVWHSELKNRAKDGSEFWEDSTIIPSFDNNGNVDGYIAFKLEINETIRLREELKEQEEIMIAQSRHAAMGEMISMIAHQWRQPISVIAMDANNILVDIELNTVDNISLKEDITDMLSQTKYLSQTIDDFRNFFKPSKIKDEVLVSDVFKEALSVIIKSLQNHNIEVENNFDTTTKVFIFSRELLQVFINILKNSKEALEDKKTGNKKIINKIYEDKHDIVVSICDNANGIDNDIIDKIFDPYFTTKDEKNGTGIGLYMSKSIIEKHLNGSIVAYNNEHGVCFEIRIPIEKMTRDKESND